MTWTRIWPLSRFLGDQFAYEGLRTTVLGYWEVQVFWFQFPSEGKHKVPVKKSTPCPLGFWIWKKNFLMRKGTVGKGEVLLWKENWVNKVWNSELRGYDMARRIVGDMPWKCICTLFLLRVCAYLRLPEGVSGQGTQAILGVPTGC